MSNPGILRTGTGTYLIRWLRVTRTPGTILGSMTSPFMSDLHACGVEIHFDLAIAEPAPDEETVIGRAHHEDLLSDQILDVVFTD
jgi:hypothetical protein